MYTKPSELVNVDSSVATSLFRLETVRQQTHNSKYGYPYLSYGHVVNLELAEAMAYEQKENTEAALGHLALARSIYEKRLRSSASWLSAPFALLAAYRIKEHKLSAMLAISLAESASSKVERDFRRSPIS